MVSLVATLGCGALGLRHTATSPLGENPLSGLVAFAIAAAWDQTSFTRRHFCGQALVRLSPQLAIAMSWQCQSVVLLPLQSLQISAMHINMCLRFHDASAVSRIM